MKKNINSHFSKSDTIEFDLKEIPLYIGKYYHGNYYFLEKYMPKSN